MRIKKLIKPVLFLIILALLTNVLKDILKKPVTGRWESSGFERVYSNKNYYDVIFCGSSMSLTNVNNVELYTEYGIAPVTIGEPTQAMFLTYYSLEEALKYQSPEVVCLDISSMFYTDEALAKCMKEEYNYIHYTLDNMRNNKTKYNAFLQAKEINPKLNFWDYFSVFYYGHANWENITKDNFVHTENNMAVNGNTMVFEVYENYAQGGPAPLSEQENTDEVYEFTEINRKYLEKIIALCEEKGTNLIFLRSGGSLPWTWERYNAISDIAEKYQIPFLESGQYEEEMGFDWTTDLADDRHFNVIGTRKWTDILGKYLIENYEFEDRRLDSEYDDYKKDQIKWQNALEAMQTKLDLLGSMDFDSYLDTLNQIDREDNTIFISVKFDGTKNLTDESISKLRQLGFKLKDITEKYKYSLVGVADSTGIRGSVKDKKVTLKGELDNQVSYKVCSGGGTTQDSASIMIGGVEYITGGRGFNIVVYNKALDMVLSSVYFNTYESENPPTARMVSTQQTQYEAEMNVWVAE